MGVDVHDQDLYTDTIYRTADSVVRVLVDSMGVDVHDQDLYTDTIYRTADSVVRVLARCSVDFCLK